MPRPIQDIRFHQGLLESVETSIPQPEFATDLLNWIPEPSGGLRCRASWTKGSTTGVPATRKGKGIGLFQRSTDPVVLQTTEWTEGVAATSPGTTGVLTWRQPTITGNTLVMVLTVGMRASTLAFTVPAGFTLIQQSADAIGSVSTTAIAVWENAPSQLGDFTFTVQGSTGNEVWKAVAFEVGNVADVGVVVLSATARGDAVTTLASGSLTNSQDSALLISAVGAEDITSNNTLTTTSDGWSRLTKSDSVGSATEIAGAVFIRPVTSVAAYSIDVKSSAPADMSLVAIALRGWYAPGAIRQVSSPFVGNGTSVSVLPVWDVPTLEGSTLVLMVMASTSTPSITPSVTASAWTSTTAAHNTTTRTAFSQGFYILDAAAQSGVLASVSVSAASAVDVTAFLIELVGVASFDDDGQAASSGATTLAPSATTTQAWDIEVSAISVRGSVTNFTGTPPTEMLDTDVVLGTRAHGVAMRTSGATGATASTFTWTTSNPAAATTLAFKAVRTAYVSEVAQYLVAHDNTTSYDIYAIDRDDMEAGTGAFEQIDSVAVDDTTLPVAFVLGLGAAWYTAAGFEGVRRYDGVFPSTVEGSPAGARCLAIHKSRLWAGGSKALPTRLSFSQAGDGLTWTGIGTGYRTIGSDDGEPIEDIAPFENGLVSAKRTSAYFTQGEIPEQFFDIRLNAGSAAPGRSLMPTAYGCVFAGPEQVWLFDGQAVQPIGRGVERSYGLQGDFVSCSYIDGSVYIADSGAGLIFVFNLLGQWRKEQIGSAAQVAAESAAVLYNYGGVQLYSPVAGTQGSLLNVRSFPNPTRATDFSGLGMVFRAHTPDMWLVGPRARITPTKVLAQMRQRGGDQASAGVKLDAIYDDRETISTETFAPHGDGLVWRDQKALGKANSKGSIMLKLTHIPTDAVFDVENLALETIVEDATP
jgi:hypothetical protein